MTRVLDFELQSGRQGPSRETSGVVVSLEMGRSPPGAYVLFANFPISSFSFVSPRVSVITLKSLKLWVILRFDVGFFFFFF